MTIALHRIRNPDRRQAERCRLRALADRLPSLTNGELADLRRYWRRQADVGYQTAAEPDVIPIEGGK